MAPPGQQCYAAGREAKRRPGPFFELRATWRDGHRHATSLALSDVRLGLGQPRGLAARFDDRRHRHRRALHRARGPAAACPRHSLEFRADAAPSAAAQDQGATRTGRDHRGYLGVRHHLRAWLDAVASGRATCERPAALSARACRQDLGLAQVGGIVGDLRQHCRRAEEHRGRDLPEGRTGASGHRRDAKPGRACSQ